MKHVPHLAPLALNASVVFEQEYSGIEGDSASCAELYTLLSALSGLPLRQDVAVTGALNQHGEVLPVGGLNEKIEGWFRTCAQAGLTGTQGVLVPARNQRHLMLSPQVVEAVARGQDLRQLRQRLLAAVFLVAADEHDLLPLPRPVAAANLEPGVGRRRDGGDAGEGEGQERKEAAHGTAPGAVAPARQGPAGIGTTAVAAGKVRPG